MKVSLRGVRGSIPTTGADTNRHGGNTSCNVVSEDGWTLVLDGGSGMQRLSIPKNQYKNRVDILLTHLHLDHIQGLGFFSPLFDPKMEVHIWGPCSSTQSLHSRLSRYLSPPLFPVLIRDLPCVLILHEIENSEFAIGPFTINSCYIIHPGPTVGFRIRDDHSVFAYLPDHEPALGRSSIINDPHWVSGIDLATGADLLYHDAQYTREEYQHKIGWGHSSMDDALSFASIAMVKKLILGHHDPSHSDKQLDDQFQYLQNNHPVKFQFEFAEEGREYEI